MAFRINAAKRKFLIRKMNRLAGQQEILAVLTTRQPKSNVQWQPTPTASGLKLNAIWARLNYAAVVSQRAAREAK